MTYGSTLLATNFGPACWQVRGLRALLFFIPRANPDNEPLYRNVRKWYLELNDSGVPVREIGLDANGRPLFGAPDARNFGFWTDSTEAIQKDQFSPVSPEEFERLWHEIQTTKERCMFSKLKPLNRFVFCSFCGKTKDEVKKLVQGPGVLICDSCVAACTKIISGEEVPKSEGSAAPSLILHGAESPSNKTSSR